MIEWVMLTIGVGCLAVALGWLPWDGRKQSHALAPSEPAAQDPALYVELGQPSKQMVGDGLLVEHIATITRDHVSFGRRTAPIQNGDPIEFHWKPKVQTAKLTVTNYGQEPLTDVRIEAHVKAAEVIKTAAGAHTGETIRDHPTELTIPKIDPGKENSETIYVSNPTDYFITLELGGAKAMPIAAAAPTEFAVKTNTPYRIIMLSPWEDKCGIM